MNYLFGLFRIVVSWYILLVFVFDVLKLGVIFFIPEIAAQTTQEAINYLIIEMCVTGAFAKFAWKQIILTRDSLRAQAQERIQSALEEGNKPAVEELLKDEHVENVTRKALTEIIRENIKSYNIGKDDAELIESLEEEKVAQNSDDSIEDMIEMSAPYFSKKEFDFLLGYMKLEVVHNNLRTPEAATEAYATAVLVVMTYRYEASKKDHSETYDELKTYIDNLVKNTVIHKNKIPDELTVGDTHG